MTATVEKEPPPTGRRRRFAFLVRPGWLGAIAGALAFTAACWLILAPWQFSRNAENSAANHAINAALTGAPVPVRQHLSTTAEPPASATYQQVTATGVFDPTNTFYVRLRQDQGNPASEVVLPMKLDDGTVLLVDRGYRSFGDIQNDDLQHRDTLPPVPTGRVTVTGRVQQDQTDPSKRPPTRDHGRIEAYAVNADALAGGDGTVGTPTTAGTVLQGYIQLVAGSPGVLTEIGMPQTDDGPYLSYALQWCAFGAMSLLAIGYFIFREATDPRGPDERNVAYPERTRYPEEVSDPREPSTGPSDSTEQPAPATGRKGRTKRAPRDGFDRSQLFDEKG